MFWFAQLLYGVACVFGPFIASNLSPAQKHLQSWLIGVIVGGVIFTPLLYISALVDHAYPNVKYVLLYPISLIPGIGEAIASPWLCLVSPVFLIAAVAVTFLFFKIGKRNLRKT